MVGINWVPLGYTEDAAETSNNSFNCEEFFYKTFDKRMVFRTQESTRGQFRFACVRDNIIDWHFFVPSVDKVAVQVF